MRIATFIVVVLVGASPAKAVATPGFCDNLRLMTRSVRDTPPFASVTRILPRPELALFRDCYANQVGFINSVSCAWRLRTAPAIEDLAAEAMRCLPGARRRDESAATTRGEARLSFEMVAITIGRDHSIPAMPGEGVRITVEIPEG